MNHEQNPAFQKVNVPKLRKETKKLSDKEIKERIDIIKNSVLFGQYTTEEIQNSMVRVAFDFDGTLSETYFDGTVNKSSDEIRNFFVELQNRGVRVCVMTRRYGHEYNEGKENEHQTVFEFAEKFGLDKNDVHFTDREYKVNTLHDLGVHLLIDDDPEECYGVRKRFSIYNAVCVDSNHNNGVLWRRGAEAMIRFFIQIYVDKS